MPRKINADSRPKPVRLRCKEPSHVPEAGHQPSGSSRAVPTALPESFSSAIQWQHWSSMPSHSSSWLTFCSSMNTMRRIAVSCSESASQLASRTCTLSFRHSAGCDENGDGDMPCCDQTLWLPAARQAPAVVAARAGTSIVKGLRGEVRASDITAGVLAIACSDRLARRSRVGQGACMRLGIWRISLLPRIFACALKRASRPT